MKVKRQFLPGLFSAMGMMLLILDSKTAMQAAVEGLDLCIKTVIPSLLPFIVLSMILTESMAGASVRILRPICRLCGIPNGAESLLLIGLIGGYPVGAQCITHTWRSGQLSKDDAHRMLAFCSNAGPSFIFGMAASLFHSPWVVWILWLIQIGSALLTGFILAKNVHTKVQLSRSAKRSYATSLESSISVMAGICGWVIMFRILTAFCNKWFMNLFPVTIRVIVTGLLELTNGCIALNTISEPSIRFILCSIFLSFGGFCVGMQTISVTAELGTGLYFPGKLLQCGIAFMLSTALQSLLFPAGSGNYRLYILLPLVLPGILLIKYLKIRRNNSRNLSPQRV